MTQIPTLSSKRKQILFIILLALLTSWSQPTFSRVSYLLSSHDNNLVRFVPLEPETHSFCAENE